LNAVHAEPLNVLFIAVDDLRPELGCYGAAHAQSPHLDALASKSMLFENHFVQVPTCGASRFALLTGRSPSNSGITSSNGAFYSGKTALSAKELPGAQTMPELFRRSGYETVLIGKISHTADGLVFGYNGSGDGRDEMPGAWSQSKTPLGPWKRGWGIFFAYANGKHREDGQGHKDVMEFSAINDDDLPDGLMAATATEQLRSLAKQDKPFFMGLGFFKPHLPFVATKKDWDAFEGDDIPLPAHPMKPDSPYWHGSGEFFKYNFPFNKKPPLPNDSVQHARRAYLACVRYTDRQIGRVLKTLDETALADNTVVVVWGDHGWNLGDSSMWAKHTPFERAVRSPLIIHTPSMKAGARTTALAETLDLYPTLVELCSPDFQKTEQPLDGKSLVPVLHDPSASVREAAVSYWKKGITARSQTHRLIVTKSESGFKNIELYDATTQFDPVKNLAKQNPDVVEGLLDAIRKETESEE